MTYRLHWREDGYTSALEHRGEALLRVEPCGELLPGMWRIQLPDGAAERLLQVIAHQGRGANARSPNRLRRAGDGRPCVRRGGYFSSSIALCI